MGYYILAMLRFGKVLNSIKGLYFEGAEMEKSFTIKNGCSGFELFEKLARRKSAFIALIPLMLCFSAEDFEHSESLQESLLYLHVAMQLIDDIEDFLIDLKKSQVTYAHTSTREHLIHLGIDIELITDNELYKYYFASGLVLDHLKQAREKFDLSLKLVNNLPIPEYQNYINEIGIQKVVYLQETIEDSISKAKCKIA